ncbi:MAG TPA: GNAT family N-acetyltransferase, partial [Candidatus Hydrogenedentes bacterium]|nr:GNAT family N-acetyltransferase [Candidatus Hydrogenedentota bacterium]
ARLAKTLQPEAPGVAGRIVVCPKHPEFGGVVPALDNAGFKIIELDLDGAYAADPRLEPQTMLAGLSQSAVYYAEKLRAHNYFRLDPIAPLFWRIYNGSPQPRSDPAGTNELAVDETGHVYPSWRLMGREEFRLGALQDGIIDEERLAEFENVGSVTTAACMRCWARNLCGGGTAAVHHALTGSFRTPCPDWCNAQREWMAAAVSAFNILSSAGVNFSRVYNTLASSAKPSLFALARAAFRMTVGMRPIEEADAAMLARWENWSDAAYFVYDESAVLMATRYDREMDALHPRGIDHELILLRKSGAPFGLLKIRPEQTPGTARAFVYLRNEADYAADSVRRGFRAILKEAGAQQSLRSFTVPAMKWEKKFAEFLLALGFSKAGTQREAVYLHGHYHDVDLYAGCTEKL